MGHVTIWCGTCHDEGRETTFYEPPHDQGWQPPNPWLVKDMPG
jgi:hypothetical protein